MIPFGLKCIQQESPTSFLLSRQAEQLEPAVDKTLLLFNSYRHAGEKL